MEAIYNNFLAWIDSSKYVLLFIGMIIEGPIVTIASGFLYKLGQFSLLPMYFVLVFGDFTADLVWYCVGRFGTRTAIFKYGHFIGITPEAIAKIERVFYKFHQKILIISKLTMGFGFAVVVLVVAGIFKIPFRNYVIFNLIGGFIWTTMLVTIGFFLGNIFMAISKPTKVLFIIFIFTLLILSLRYMNKYLKKITI